MPLELLHDSRLIFISVLAGVVTFLTATTVASRPAAIITRRVAMAFTMYNIFFMITRFANLFYLPLLGTYVDKAEESGDISMLLIQIRFVLGGAALGSLLAWLFLPSLIETYTRGIRSLERNQSMVRVILNMLHPKRWVHVFTALRRPGNFGVSLLRLEGVPPGFLFLNIFATAIWTVGALAALYASALHPEYERTSTLLSGLVNFLPAILFSMIVDPKASLITDQAIAGTRPEKQVYITAVFLSAGNLLGTLLSQFCLVPGAKIIEAAALALGRNEAGVNLLVIVLISTIVTMKASTTVAARIAAVMTKRVATALAIYNFFFLITRIAQQVYAPIIGTLGDVAARQHTMAAFLGQIRWVIMGCTIGAILGWIFMTTFVEIYRKAIAGMEKYGSLYRLIMVTLFSPSSWLKVIQCFRLPGMLGVHLKDVREIPRNFLIGNVIVISIHTVGVLAATYASALFPEYGRATTLLSSVVNGVATIVLSIVVDPIAALITDKAVAGERPFRHVKIMAVFLAAGTVLGTMISQLILVPSAYFIKFCAEILVRIF